MMHSRAALCVLMFFRVSATHAAHLKGNAVATTKNEALGGVNHGSLDGPDQFAGDRMTTKDTLFDDGSEGELSIQVEDFRPLTHDRSVEERNLHHNFRCSTDESQHVCLVGATLDGNRLQMTTYCPLGSDSIADCTCTVHHRGQQCNSCSYCSNTQVFVVDCSNAISNGRCAAVDCDSRCYSWGTEDGGSSTYPGQGSSSSSSGSGDLSRESVAAIAVFATMCCLPCLTAMLCARLIPRRDYHAERDAESAAATSGGAQDRQTVIDACLKTVKVDQEEAGETTDDVDRSKSSVTEDSASTTSRETEEETEDNCDASSEEASEEEAVDAVPATMVEQQGDLVVEEQGDLAVEDLQDNEDVCQICLEPFRTGDEQSWSQVSKCSHSFHKDCITEWLQRHDDCPCCRAKYLSFDGIPEDEDDCNV